MPAPFTSVFVTGCAGFIGYHVAEALLRQGVRVSGLDSVDDYYDPSLKRARLERLAAHENFNFHQGDLAIRSDLDHAWELNSAPTIIHLAAQAGVRHSLKHPEKYVESNLIGFANLLELCRHRGVEHLVYASTSSVYGANTSLPFQTSQSVDHPVSFYAATKKANELMAHSYSHLYRIPTTGLRFFTVYGPWGRPDMALFLFTKAILAGEPIRVFNNGQMRRDFTFIDDIVDGVLRIAACPAQPDPEWSGNHPNPATSSAPYRVYNIGNHQSVELMRFIEVLEEALGKKAIIDFQPMQPGDVPETYADVSDLTKAVGFQPRTPIEVGIPKFVAWYRDFYGV
jgi:UDP-glucuronate 4-epimerase